MQLAAHTMAERPDLIEESTALHAVWPEYNNHGVMEYLLERVHLDLPEFQLVFVEPDTGAVVARGRTIPVAWDGTVQGLPDGIDGALTDGFAVRRAGRDPNALCALAAEVLPSLQGRGLARQVLTAMRRCAADHGLADGLIAPVRPSWKERYPITPIQRYAAWRRDDGRLFDPWMRVHERLGARILRPEPESLRITGSVGEWEAWTELEFPESGTYVFPRGLSTVRIDRQADVGLYWEPSVWMHHR